MHAWLRYIHVDHIYGYSIAKQALTLCSDCSWPFATKVCCQVLFVCAWGDAIYRVNTHTSLQSSRQCTGCPRWLHKFIGRGMQLFLRIVYNILRGFTEGCFLPPCTKAALIPKPLGWVCFCKLYMISNHLVSAVASHVELQVNQNRKISGWNQDNSIHSIIPSLSLAWGRFCLKHFTLKHFTHTWKVFLTCKCSALQVYKILCTRATITVVKLTCHESVKSIHAIIIIYTAVYLPNCSYSPRKRK